MSVRKTTSNRLSLVRTCQTCGRSFSTTASTPWIRQMAVDGKRQKTCYFCSEACKAASYKHIFDGHAADRREERKAARDRSERNRQYYLAHAEDIRAAHRAAYHSNPEEYRARNRYNKEKRALA